MKKSTEKYIPPEQLLIDVSSPLILDTFSSNQLVSICLCTHFYI